MTGARIAASIERNRLSNIRVGFKCRVVPHKNERGKGVMLRSRCAEEALERPWVDATGAGRERRGRTARAASTAGNRRVGVGRKKSDRNRSDRARDLPTAADGRNRRGRRQSAWDELNRSLLRAAGQRHAALMIFFISSTEKARRDCERTLPSEPTFSSAVVTASSDPSTTTT